MTFEVNVPLPISLISLPCGSKTLTCASSNWSFCGLPSKGGATATQTLPSPSTVADDGAPRPSTKTLTL